MWDLNFHAGSKNVFKVKVRWALLFWCSAVLGCEDGPDIEECLREFHADTELALNEQYKLATLSVPKGKRESLRLVESAWVDYRQDVCGNLNDLDRLGCESSLNNQRSQELFMIVRRSAPSIGRGVIDLLSQGARISDQAALDLIAKHRIQAGPWEVYAGKHCEFRSGVVAEPVIDCKIRLIMSNWSGF